MVTITAQDALGTGLVLYADADGNVQSIFSDPVTPYLVLETDWEDDNTLYRLWLDGADSSIVAASAVGPSDATSVDINQITYEDSTGSAAITITDLDTSLELANYPSPFPPKVSNAVLGFVGAGVFDLGGDDRITGNDHDDFISGMGGNDLLIGRGGDDFLFGGDGDDTLKGGSGTDVLDGGEGSDIVSYAGLGHAITADLGEIFSTGHGLQNDTVINIEGIAATAFDDTVIGDSGANRIYGGTGDDQLRGSGGSDRIQGGLWQRHRRRPVRRGRALWQRRG